MSLSIDAVLSNLKDKLPKDEIFAENIKAEFGHEWLEAQKRSGTRRSPGRLCRGFAMSHNTDFKTF